MIRKAVRRAVSVLLAVTLMFPGSAFYSADAASYSDHLDGWSVDCVWSDNSYECACEMREDTIVRPKLIFSYRMENAEHDYAPGSLSVQIPGIGYACRKEVEEAYSLPTDSADSEWDVVWDQNSDTYTFSNKFDVREGQSVNGGFEMIWELEGRKTQDGYHQKRSPVFSVEGSGSIMLRPLSFSFTSARDLYHLTLSRDSLSLSMSEKADADHIWYAFTASFEKRWLARGLYLSDCSVKLETTKAVDPDDIIIADEKGKPIEYTPGPGGEISFYLFKNKPGDLGDERKTCSASFMIGVPRGVMDGEELTLRVHLDRLYNDETEWVRTAGEGECVDAEMSVTVDEYAFTWNGRLYSTDIWNEDYENYLKPPHFYWYGYEDELTHTEPPEYDERLCAADLYNGTVVEFSLRGSAVNDFSPAAAMLSASPSDAALPDIPAEYETGGEYEEMILPLQGPASPSNARSAQDEGYSMVLGDDALAIYLQDGSLRFLEDDEYDFSYVRLPDTDRPCSYEIFGADTRDVPFDSYRLLASDDTSSPKSFSLPDGIKALYVRFNSLEGNFSAGIKAGVRLFLDYSKEQKKDEAARPDPENRLVNFSFFRALCKDKQNVWHDDCVLTEDDYAGSCGEKLAGRDMEIYGEYMLRDYSNVWLRSAALNLKAAVAAGPFVQEDEHYTSRIEASGTLKSEDEGEIRRFSIYTVLPEGLRTDFYKGTVTVTGSLTAMNGGEISHPEDYVSFSEGTYLGKKMIIADFDFSGSPLRADAVNRVSISYPVTLSRADQAVYGSGYTVSVYLLPHDEGIDKITGSAIMSDIWDMDQNGDTSEKMAYAGTKVKIEEDADEWREYASKYVKSAFSGGYVKDAVTTRPASDGEKEDSDSLYEYRLDMGLGSSAASDIIFFDRLEQGAYVAVNSDKDAYERVPSEWQGTFCSVDISYAGSLGLKPCIYYSTDAAQDFDLSSEGWVKECPADRSKVKSIAVSLDTTDLPEEVLKGGSFVYIIIKMRAPGDAGLTGRKAVNQYVLSYNSHGSSGAYEGRFTLPSAPTTLKLLDSVGRIILEKVDADNVIRTDAEGMPHYATLTGGTFQIYDESGIPLFDTPRGLDPMGRLVVDDIPLGTYYWEEVTSPDGYERVEGRHAFSVEGTSQVITVENHRLPGDVTLIKHDQDDPEQKPLPGAVYELAMQNGEKVFTDASYRYLPGGNNSTFITDDDGTFTVTGLPWGSYEFTEVAAPEGYMTSSDPVPFTVGKSSYDAETGSITVTLDAYDAQLTSSLLLRKTDSLSREGLAGALYSLCRVEDGGDVCIASGLKTDIHGEIAVDGLKFGTYYFSETQNPPGYLLPFPDDRKTEVLTLDAGTAGETLEVSHEDERMKGSVRLSKCDLEGRPVPGAGFDLYRKADDGSAVLIGSYATCADKEREDYGEIFAGDLEWGDYCFIETRAPQGYRLAEDPVCFTVDRNTAQNIIDLRVVNERLKGSVKIVKADRHDGTVLLPGAEFALYFSSGKPCVAGVDYELPEGCSSIVTGDDGSITITGLKQGAYFLKEVTPPGSYSLSGEPIRFSVTMDNAALLQELLVRDDKDMAVLTIDKQVNDVYEAFGDPTFIFRITRSDGVAYYASITLAPRIHHGSVSLNVEQGYTYTVEEVGISRYLPCGVEAVKNASADEAENTAVADLLRNTEAEIRFCDSIEQYEKFSHSANAVNSVKRSAMLTALTVNYTGPDPITPDLPGFDPEEEIYLMPPEDLEVTAFYDDGTSRIIPYGGYELSPAFADGNSESYTGRVSVMSDGVQRDAYFSVGISLPVPTPRCMVTYELNGGMIIPPGQSSMTDAYTVRVKRGSTLTRPVSDPIRENFSFKGWYLDKDLKREAEFPLTITQDMSIYAGWEAQPVNVRYAVKLYGIQSEKDSHGNVAGLTFGPALGEVLLFASRSHTPSEGQRCLHFMTWDEIAGESRKDPGVFRECLKNGCTHAVDLTIAGELAAGVSIPQMTGGDGASVLFDCIDSSRLKWDSSSGGGASYASSDIRKVLNGGAQGEQYSLTDALPDDLSDAIQKKDVDGHDDTLWLFSAEEIYRGNGHPAEADAGHSGAGNRVGRAEDGRAVNFWLRDFASEGHAAMITEDGSYGEQDMNMDGGIAFGFCLQGPEPDTRLAMSLYGIRHDTCVDDTGHEFMAGLTFGPALGGDYRESFISHSPSGKTSEGNRHRCIHGDDWDTIAYWSGKDPYVYEQCLGDSVTPACTKGLDLCLSDELLASRFSFGGDGSGVLFAALAAGKHSFSYPYSDSENVPNDGGWPASYTRAVLNGADEYTNRLCDGGNAVTLEHGLPIAGDDPPGMEESIFSCLPSGLRENIVPKVVISDTWYDDTDTAGHTVATHDKLWLFSAHEIWAQGAFSEKRANEGSIYERQSLKNTGAAGTESCTAVYDEKGKGYMALRTIEEDKRYNRYGISKNGSLTSYEVCKDSLGIGFGFCLR